MPGNDTGDAGACAAALHTLPAPATSELPATRRNDRRSVPIRSTSQRMPAVRDLVRLSGKAAAREQRDDRAYSLVRNCKSAGRARALRSSACRRRWSGTGAFRRRARAATRRSGRHSRRGGIAMRLKLIVWVAGFVWLIPSGVLAQSWTLPQGKAVKDNGPRTYRFTMDHTIADTVGRIVQRQRVAGEYTRGLPGGDAVWNSVTVAESTGAAEISAAGQAREFMEGFRYPAGAASLAESMKPEFFKGFPPAADLRAQSGVGYGHDRAVRPGTVRAPTVEHALSTALVAGRDDAGCGYVPQPRRAADVGWTVATKRGGLRPHRLPRLVQPRGDRQRKHDLEGPKPLLGRDLGVSRHQADRVRHAVRRRAGRNDARRAGAPRTINVFRSGVFEPVARK